MRDHGRVSISSAVPVGQPLHGASFGQATKRFFQGYARFSGRASRSEFWWAVLFATIVSLVAQVPFWVAWFVFMMRAVALESGSPSSPSSAPPADMVASMGAMLVWMALLLLVSLALFLPSLALMWRRLQDAGFHGALSLLSIAGLGIVPFILCCFPSNPAGLQFDPAARAQLAAQQPYGAAYGQPRYAPPGFEAHDRPAYGSGSEYGQGRP